MQRRTHFELRAALRELQMMQTEFATIMGVEPITVYRWYHGQRQIPGAVWTVLAFLDRDKLANIKKGMPKEWIIEYEDVFPNGETYKQMIKKFHPDITRKDTNLELAVISEFKNF